MHGSRPKHCDFVTFGGQTTKSIVLDYIAFLQTVQNMSLDNIRVAQAQNSTGRPSEYAFQSEALLVAKGILENVDLLKSYRQVCVAPASRL